MNESEESKQARLKILEASLELTKTGFAGIDKSGNKVDRRQFPDAIPLMYNPAMGIPYHKIKCYELDFGDTNLISQNKKDILDWIDTDMENISENGLSYEITTKWLTQIEINALPEWS